MKQENERDPWPGVGQKDNFDEVYIPMGSLCPPKSTEQGCTFIFILFLQENLSLLHTKRNDYNTSAEQW